MRVLYRKASDRVKEECDSSLVTHQMRILECRLVVVTYTPTPTGWLPKKLDNSGQDATECHHQRSSSWARLSIAFQRTLAIRSACDRAQPSWVELNLRGRSCLWGPSHTILGTPFFGVAGSGAIVQREYAGRTGHNGKLLYIL